MPKRASGICRENAGNKKISRPFQGNVPRVRNHQAPSSRALTKKKHQNYCNALRLLPPYYQHTLAYTKWSTKKHALIPSMFSPFQISQKAGQTMKSQQDLMQKAGPVRPKVESCRTWWNPLGFKHYCLEVPKGKIWFNWMDLTQHLCQNASTTENCLPFPLVNKPPFVCSFLCETNSSTHLIHQIELTWPTFTELVVSTPSKNMSRIGNHFPK